MLTLMLGWLILMVPLLMLLVLANLDWSGFVTRLSFPSDPVIITDLNGTKSCYSEPKHVFIVIKRSRVCQLVRLIPSLL